jgi:hypothetical protein
MVALNKALAASAIGCVEVETTSLAAKVTVLFQVGCLLLLNVTEN